jgi:general stress protein YciG
MSETNEIKPETKVPVAEPQKRKQGFAAMPKKAQRKLAQEGGRKAHANGTAHKFTKEEAQAAGKKGGVAVSQDREHMAWIGSQGGKKTAANLEHMSAIGKKGRAKSLANQALAKEQNGTAES